MNIQVCRDTSDAVALYLPQRLYLKPFAKLNISVQLPPNKVHGKSLSNWELMEKIRKMIQPESFSVLKVSKHSTEVIRFDAELENRDKLDRVLMRLNDRTVSLTNYPVALQLKVSEAKLDFPSRHSWDAFFRDATDMDEMKPGERPDTVHIANLPICWFVHERDRDADAPPSESIFKRVFEKFGSIRQVDVPVADPYRMQMKTIIRGISTPPQDAALYFEGYIQFSEYVGFVRCMDALRGTKLLRKKDDLSEWCGIRVDFDKTKHMTDAAVKRRAIVRERLVSRQRAKENDEKQEKEKISRKEAKERQKYERVEREKLEKMREREEKRKKKQLSKLMQKDNLDLNSKVAEEQKKLLKVQKKLQAIRLIEELFNRIELRPELQRNGSHSGRYYASGERSARQRIVDRCKRQQEAALDDQRNQLKCALDGRIVIRSALEIKKSQRDSSISSMSSEEDRNQKRIKRERLTTPEREMEFNKAAGMYGMGAPPYGFGYPFAAVPPPSFYPPQRVHEEGGAGGTRAGAGEAADAVLRGTGRQPAVLQILQETNRVGEPKRARQSSAQSVPLALAAPVVFAVSLPPPLVLSLAVAGTSQSESESKESKSESESESTVTIEKSELTISPQPQSVSLPLAAPLALARSPLALQTSLAHSHAEAHAHAHHKPRRRHSQFAQTPGEVEKLVAAEGRRDQEILVEESAEVNNKCNYCLLVVFY